MTTSSDSPTSARITAQLGVKQRLGDDRQRQVHHVFVWVLDMAIMPGFEHALGVLDHHGRVAFDFLALKRGLRQLSLPPPERSFAGQESLADQRNQPPRQHILHEIVGVRSQDIIDMLGVDEHIGRRVSQPQPHDVAVLADRSSSKSRADRACRRTVFPSRKLPLGPGGTFPRLA